MEVLKGILLITLLSIIAGISQASAKIQAPDTLNSPQKEIIRFINDNLPDKYFIKSLQKDSTPKLIKAYPEVGERVNESMRKMLVEVKGSSSFASVYHFPQAYELQSTQPVLAGGANILLELHNKKNGYGEIPSSVVVVRSENKDIVLNIDRYIPLQEITYKIPKTDWPVLCIQNPNGGNCWNCSPWYVISLDKETYLKNLGKVSQIKDIDKDGVDDLIEYEDMWEDGLGWFCHADALGAKICYKIDNGRLVADTVKNSEYWNNEIRELNKQINILSRKIPRNATADTVRLMQGYRDSLLHAILEKFLRYRLLGQSAKGWDQLRKNLRYHDDKYFFFTFTSPMNEEIKTGKFPIQEIEETIRKSLQHKEIKASEKLKGSSSFASQKGLTGAFRLEKDSYVVGEPVIAVFEVTNNGDDPYSFDAGANSGAGLFCSVKIRNEQGKDLTNELDGIISAWITPVTLEPNGDKFREYLMISSRTHLLPTGDYSVEISRTLSAPRHIRPNIEIDLEKNKPVAFSDKIHFTVVPYDYAKLKDAISESRLNSRQRTEGIKMFTRKPVNLALLDVSRKFDMGFPGGKQVPRQEVIKRLPKKWDDSYFLDESIDQNRNWVTGSVPEDYELTFRIANNSNKRLESGVFESRLYVDGQEVKDWRQILIENLSDKGAGGIEAGNTLEFSRRFNSYIKITGEHEIEWKINNAVKTRKVNVRESRIQPLPHERVSEMFDRSTIYP